SLPRPYIGLLRGKPMLAGIAECSYIAAPERTLVEASLQVRKLLRDRIGFSKPTLPSLADWGAISETVHGTPGPTLREYWAKTLGFVRRAKTHNQLMACVVRFLRGLGLRYASLHYHPVQYFSAYPIPCLEILDKAVNGHDRPRYLPISANIALMIKACAKLIPRSELLLYRDGGKL